MTEVEREERSKKMKYGTRKEGLKDNGLLVGVVSGKLKLAGILDSWGSMECY